jgi:predicted transcriptional regulator
LSIFPTCSTIFSNGSTTKPRVLALPLTATQQTIISGDAMGQVNTLRNLKVSKAMRRQIIQLGQDKTIGHGINHLTKHKVNALLIVDTDRLPVGVVSKTDIMGAYYAGLPIDSTLDHIMVSPPLFCKAGDSLEDALEQMRSSRVYRLYVTTDDPDELVGALAYPDIVGFLYQYCHRCEYSHLYRKKQGDELDSIDRFTVRELMTSGVKSLPLGETLNSVMEALSAYRFGAMLITGTDGLPCGVLSKSDLVLAYLHGVDPEVLAKEVMQTPIHSCAADSLLEGAIKEMIIADIHRIFVHQGDAANIVGVLSLSDAARGRSGSCHACVSSRIKVEE